jgi:ATP-binding cassette subfamily F protein 3
MLVSHDRAMLREVCDEFWLVTRGGVLPFDGDLDDYQKWLLEVSRANSRGQPAPAVPGAPVAAPPAPAIVSSRAAAKPAAAPPAGVSRDDRKAKGQARSKLADQTRPLRIELATIDERLAKLGAERSRTEAILASSSVASSAIADAGRQLAHIAAEVAMLEERWLELHQQLENIVPAR